MVILSFAFSFVHFVNMPIALTVICCPGIAEVLKRSVLKSVNVSVNVSYVDYVLDYKSLTKCIINIVPAS